MRYDSKRGITRNAISLVSLLIHYNIINSFIFFFRTTLPTRKMRKIVSKNNASFIIVSIQIYVKGAVSLGSLRIFYGIWKLKLLTEKHKSTRYLNR